MKILVTGNEGYVGPLVGRHLKRRIPDTHLVGYDTSYFALSTTNAPIIPERVYNQQFYGDIRDFEYDLLRGVDVVVHLAAISNDPMGNKYESATTHVNTASSIRLAEMSSAAGVKHFVFASSCSVYGLADGPARKETDALNPQTTYAKSKIDVENSLKQIHLGKMKTSVLRFATACGMSDRLRLDLVLNDFVACAMASRKISVLSDGTPWRPLIDVRDMARAIEWAVTRENENGGQHVTVNVGSNERNYQVSELALAVTRAIPGSTVEINQNALPDTRSYKVDFELFRRLAPGHQPIITLMDSINGMRDGLTEMGFSDPKFRCSAYMRLRMLELHIEAGRLNSNLMWNQNFLNRE